MDTHYFTVITPVLSSVTSQGPSPFVSSFALKCHGKPPTWQTYYWIIICCQWVTAMLTIIMTHKMCPHVLTSNESLLFHIISLQNQPLRLPSNENVCVIPISITGSHDLINTSTLINTNVFSKPFFSGTTWKLLCVSSFFPCARNTIVQLTYQVVFTQKGATSRAFWLDNIKSSLVNV